MVIKIFRNPDRYEEGIATDTIASMKVKKNNSKNTWMLVTLTEGKNREIRRVLNHFDLQVNRLIRVAFGPYSLGDLKPGELKSLDSH